MNARTLATGAQGAAARRLLELINGNWATQAIGVAAGLGLADRMAEGLTQEDALAAACDCDADALRRLLRGLAALGLVHQEDGGHWRLGATGELLRSDAALSLNAHAQWWSRQAWAVWAELMGSVRTGHSMRRRQRGQRGFEHLEADAATAQLFHRSMVELTRLVAPGLAASPLFPDRGVVMDLGGGHGVLLAEVLRCRPALHGLLVDLDHAMAGARAHLQGAGVADRVTLAPGDFFVALPGPVDVVLLKSVLHDWDDAHATRILQRAREALAPGGRVLVIERVMPARVASRPEDRIRTRSDLNMLVGLGGRERTRQDYEALLCASGLVLRRVLPAQAAFSVIEAGQGDEAPPALA